MLNPRDQGHALLHRICLLAVVFLWFWVAVDFWESWEFSLITLPWNYALVGMAGLLVASFGSLQNYGTFYIKNGWQRVRESFSKANFQSSLIAFFMASKIFRLLLVFFRSMKSITIIPPMSLSLSCLAIVSAASRLTFKADSS